VDAPASADAAALAAEKPALGVGLHVVLADPGGAEEDEIERQLRRFTELTGTLPTHIDTHHNVHLAERVLPAFLALAERHGLPLRGHCGVHHIPTFYGQWDGEAHPEAVSPAAFERIVADEVSDGFNELCCHPGRVDADLASSYTVEREAELLTLCDPSVAALLRENGVELATFRDLPRT
jgi:chitin disaccharide deacetylase